MAKRMRFILSTIMVIVAMTAKAQVTTSSLSGKVTDPDKEAIIGATVQAIHEPSGTRYGAITNIDGRYTIQGMRAGGPYSVEVSYIGYQTMMYKDVTLQLGEVYNLNQSFLRKWLLQLKRLNLLPKRPEQQPTFPIHRLPACLL